MSITKIEPLVTTDQTAQELSTNIRLKNNVILVLQSHLAQKLLNGTWEYRRMGLTQFDSAVRRVWFGAKLDDPYADWFLLKTYDACLRARKFFNNFEKQCTQVLHAVRGLEVTVCSNEIPQKYSLVLKSPFGYMGAALLTDLDYSLCHVMTLKRLGLINQLNSINVHQLIDTVQRTFETPRGWKNLDLTRKDLIDNNQNAIDARTRWGQCPLAVIKRQIHFAYWPIITAIKSEINTNINGS